MAHAMTMVMPFVGYVNALLAEGAVGTMLRHRGAI
jgi:hypothetical protein